MTLDAPAAAVSLRLDGRRALVTGASSGLGWHFAETLAGAGAAVALCARRTERIAAAETAIAASGGRAAGVAMDVTVAASVRTAFDEAEQALGPVDLVINNAGVALTRAALDVAEDDWDRIIDTNLKGAWLVAREAARRMKARGGGTIVNIASILGLGVAAAVAPYAVSKAGLVQMTRVLALELARFNVRVNALAPGYIETELNRDFFASPAGERLVRRIPQRRLGRLEDLDGPLLLLAGDASRYMTGATIVVDGGHLVSSL